MRDVQTDLERWQAEGEEIAIATLVAVERSAPRLPGARLVVTRSGRMAGSVSAGCVENDVFQRAVQVLDSGVPVLTSYGISDDLGLQAGLSCGGSIDVLIEPFVATSAWESVRTAVGENSPAVLGIAIAPGPLIGRKIAIAAEGAVVGSVDPNLDGQLLHGARELLQSGGSRVVTLPWNGEEARVFLEAFLPPLRLFIVGATQIAAALCRMATILGFRVSVIDPRSPYATADRFPDADDIVRTWPQEALRNVLDRSSYVVTLTHDAKFDIPTLAAALRSNCPYVGALGSRRTHQGRRAALIEEGFPEAELDRIHAPIGLDIGARGPEEIALAILSEMIAVRRGKSLTA